MARGMRSDLAQRFARAEKNGCFIVAESSSDARRLRATVSRKEVVSPATGVFARRETWEYLKPPQRALYTMRALAILHPSWVFCGVSAAVAHGLEVSYPLIGIVTHVATSRKGRTRDTRGLCRHVFSDLSFEEAEGLRVTPLNRTVLDCLRHSSFRFGLAIADSAIRKYPVSRNDLLAYCERFNGRLPGWQKAIDTVTLADGRAESGGESVARAVMIERGFRVPELQRVIKDPISGIERRVDFYWEQVGWPSVIGELDGREKYQNPEMTRGREPLKVLADERLRESRVSLSAARIVRFSYAQAVDAEFFTYLLSAFGVPRDAKIPVVAIDPHDEEASFTHYERLFLSRWTEYQAEQRILAG